MKPVGRTECDREDMEVFFSRIRQLLPVLGSDLLIPVSQPAAKQQWAESVLHMKGVEGRGHRTPDGFVVLKGSTAVLEERKAANRWPNVVVLRKQFISDGTLIQKDGFYHFTRDVQFSSPSAAAAVIEGAARMGSLSGKRRTEQSSKNSTNKPNRAMSLPASAVSLSIRHRYRF